MREIKFRAWDKVENVMHYQYLRFVPDSKYVVVADGNGDEKFLLDVTQYTGLKDKNGVEIYEGDIVEYDKDFQNKPFLDEDGYRFEIGFSCGSFLVLDPHDSGERGGFSGFYLHTPGLTVIGNIYQNPDLLK